ncbi:MULTISPECIES: hypothetical protein [Halorussus]|uniref:hypothetical protein n=1 Tax=Halorussus TaxID=1070314 RepID=UPI00209DF142|nr:hypothetical protein [Halorussus vallis]USZ75901.1 hypothetical protein NGM07_00935 [Halorussus vallis]
MSIDVAELERTELYSEELDIDLSTGEDDALFAWFLASLLFGARISEEIARNTYRAFERHGLLSPERISDAGFEFLVDPVMREGGYVRYDNRRSRQVLRDCETLEAEYGGSLNALHDAASDSDDLEARVDDFYGVGPVTTNIFLRELRTVWKKADPDPLPVVVETADRLGVDLDGYDRKSETFARVEAGLVRRRRD